MQVFKFNPVMGKKGEKLYDIRKSSWTGQSVEYQVRAGIIEPIKAIIPESHKTAKWVFHVDAGYSDKDGNLHSYLEDQWICFCIGSYDMGDYEEWQWVVLPPKSLLIELKAAQ